MFPYIMEILIISKIDNILWRLTREIVEVRLWLGHLARVRAPRISALRPLLWCEPSVCALETRSAERRNYGAVLTET
jgi:hypothetical protein